MAPWGGVPYLTNGFPAIKYELRFKLRTCLIEWEGFLRSFGLHEGRSSRPPIKGI
jgi:hypothetical protein